jgi:pantoate--beta-alanine ligase
MKIISVIKNMQQWSKAQQRFGRTIGLVPTMGALHEGHLSLIRRSVKENDCTVVSIFVNPAQFGPREDFKKYPRPFNKDVSLVRCAGADAVFAPSVREMYPEGHSTYVEETALSQGYCGAARPGHFRGVVTVVSKLLLAALPDNAYFGEKDFQQFMVITRMARDLGFPVNMVLCPIVREQDGLALSSRNAYLNAAERLAARELFSSLQVAAKMIQSGITLAVVKKRLIRRWKKIPQGRLEYIAFVDPETLKERALFRPPTRMLIAARIGATRLIDTANV